MKIHKFLIILFLSLILVSCGGGTTESKSGNSVSIKMDFESLNRSGKADANGFMVGSTYVDSVKIGYGASGIDYQYVDVTAAAKDGTEVTIPNLRAGTTYTFSISALGSSDTTVCTGSTDVTIVENVTTDAELSCNFSGGTALELAALNMIKAAYSGTATYETISPYIATEFGVMDGMTREEFIAQMLTPENDYLFDTGIKPVNVIIPDADSIAARTNVDFGVHDIKIIYSDGSYDYGTAGLVQEEGAWKIKGNGRAHDVEMRHASVKIFTQYPFFEDDSFSGVSVWVGDDSSTTDIIGFELTGTGINSSGFTKYTNEDTWFGLTSPNVAYNVDNIAIPFPIGNVAYGMVPYNGESMGTNTEITATYSNSTTETYTVRGEGIGREAPLYYFPTLKMSFDDEHNEYVFTVKKPEMAISGMKMSFDANGIPTDNHIESNLSLVRNSFTISGDDAVFTGDPTLAFVGITVIDADMREFTSYYTLAYLYSQMDTDLNNITFYKSNFSGMGTGGFYSYMEFLLGINTNEYRVSNYITGSAIDGDSLYLANLVTPFNRLSPSYGDAKLILTKLNKDFEPYSMALEYTGYSSYPSDPELQKMLIGEDGSVYLISSINAETSSQPGIVAVLKLNAAMNQIMWMRDYHFDYYSTPRSFYEGACLMYNGGDETLVLRLNHDTNENVLLNIDVSNGSLIDAKRLVIPDNNSSEMIYNADLQYLPDVNKLVMVGTVQEPESGAYRYRLAVMVMNHDLTFYTVAMTEPITDFPQVRDVAMDDEANIYIAYGANDTVTSITKFNTLLDVDTQTYSILSITNKVIAGPDSTSAGTKHHYIRMALSGGNIYAFYITNYFDDNIYANIFEGSLIKLDTNLDVVSATNMDGMDNLNQLVPGANGSVVVVSDKIINVMSNMTANGITFKNVTSSASSTTSSLALDSSFYSMGSFSTAIATPIYGEHSPSDANLQQKIGILYNASPN